MFQQLLSPTPAPRSLALSVIEALLEKCAAGMLGNPREALAMANIAESAATKLDLAGSYPNEAAVCLGRARYLAGTASRLLGDLANAEDRLVNAVHFLTQPRCSLDRAFWCRSLALVRWEQARLDEAGALLERSAAVFSGARLEQEAGTTRALLGLLAFEEGVRGAASLELRTAKETMDLERRPWLSVRVCLALAQILAGRKRYHPALTLLQEVWGLSVQLTDPREQIVARWWEGRVQGRLGNHRDAASLLRTARLKYLEERRVPEAALVTLDVMHLAAEAGRMAEAREAVSEFKSWLGREEGACEALLALESFADDLTTQPNNLRRCAIERAAFVRRRLVVHGFRIDPLPFA